MNNKVAKFGVLREDLADLSHEIWAHWMAYLFSQCEEGPDGTVIIPQDKADRWWRQAVTVYANLSEQEKESDREQADKILKVISGHLITPDD